MIDLVASLLVAAGLLGVGPDSLVANAQVSATDCIVMNPRGFDSRPSPLDSLTFEVGGNTVKICYGRPSARGRTMIGGESVPYGKVWRTGANEPTMIHTTTPLSIAGIDIGPGSYSLYTVPGEDDWELIVNRSISQWGRETSYTDEVRAQEVGRARVSSQRLDNHVETFTIRAEPTSSRVAVFLEWEHTRVSIPVTAN
ncbi:MAG: hypothetical protein AMS18_04275 [Gemmatimonas sp. SG8_17]|nr:MAG: hypothetical protein AMS18_04275 [Gemmatimonas sp. SG8_17]